MSYRDSEWCRRLGEAIADGRFLEDPSIWMDHLRTCEECSRRAEGVLLLRQRIDAANREVPEPPPGPGREHQVIAEAFRRYRRYRRNRTTLLLGLGILLLLGLGGFWALRPTPQAPSDPVAYAQQLYDRVFPGPSDVDRAVLQKDPAMREEYLRALDNPSSWVRRTALQALIMCGIPVSPDRLARILTEWDENLEAPLEVASADGGARVLEEALAIRRTATLHTVLLGLDLQTSTGGAGVPAQVVEPFLGHVDSEVRREALMVLTRDPAYVPGDEVERLLEEDPSESVRLEAARCLVERLGDEGVPLVIAHLRRVSDPVVEGDLSLRLMDFPEGLAFCKERGASPDTPPLAAMVHLLRLQQTDRLTELPAESVAHVLASDDAWAHAMLARVAAAAHWPSVREPLQKLWWQAEAGAARAHLGANLVLWDLEAGTEERLGLALEIMERDHLRRLRDLLEKLCNSEFPSVRARARALLEDWDHR